MSTQETRASPLRNANGDRRVSASISIDLNFNLSQEPEYSSILSNCPVHLSSTIVQGNYEREATSSLSHCPLQLPGITSNSIPPPTPIDVQAFDDEVLISSPRAIEEAQTRRNRGRAIVVNDDAEYPSPCVISNAGSKRRRFSPNRISVNIRDIYIDLNGSGSSSSVGENVVQSVAPPPPPPVKEPTFNCPVCLSPFVEAVSTKCGHIFCKGCIKAAISAQHKCPTCRKRITMRGVIRVYLPTAT